MSGNGWATTEISRRRQAALRLALCVLAAASLMAFAGCPLPYQYTRQGWSGNSGTVDPSTPDITAMPTLDYSSNGGNGTLQTGQSITTTADTQITLQTNTAGSVIYYTTDGSIPDPRAASTSKYSSSSPVSLSIASPTPSNSSVVVTVKATAIGPNMKPSPVLSAKVTVQYPQASAPTFTPAAGYYLADQTITLGSATGGSTIYYTMVSGAGPAPRPQPGQAGTSQYSGGISVAGSGNTWSVSAIAVHGQLIDSTTASATFTINYLQSYATITPAEIAAASSLMTPSQINNSGSTPSLPVGQVFLYVSSSGNVGKMVLTNNNIDGNNGIGFRFTTYNPDGTVLATNLSAVCNGTYLFDLDLPPAGSETAGTPDFWAENVSGSSRYFVPQNGARFMLGGVDPAP